jgi:hypothetical protein
MLSIPPPLFVGQGEERKRPSPDIDAKKMVSHQEEYGFYNLDFVV